MNFQCFKPLVPLKVLFVNPLAPSSQLIVKKILSGLVFGKKQRIHLILLVFSNDILAAEALKTDLERCAFCCTFLLEVASTVPSISDADIFCFVTNFANPNVVDYNALEKDEQYDALFLLTKIAYSLAWPDPLPPPQNTIEKPGKRKSQTAKEKQEEPIKKIIVTDGLIALDIVKSLSKNLPSDILFCPTPLNSIARVTLAHHLKVNCNVVNDSYVWAADDQVFHVEFEKPLLRHDNPNKALHTWNAISKESLDKLNLDHTQFSASWMKKELIDKVRSHGMQNPHGNIYRASVFAETLKTVWSARVNKEERTSASLGVISDGSMGTRKGLAYVLPIIFCGDNWSTDKTFEGDSHVELEIKKINKTVIKNHDTLIPYCKKMLMLNQTVDDSSSSLSTWS